MIIVRHDAMKDFLEKVLKIFAVPKWCKVTSNCADGEEFGSSSVMSDILVGTIVEETNEALQVLSDIERRG